MDVAEFVVSAVTAVAALLISASMRVRAWVQDWEERRMRAYEFCCELADVCEEATADDTQSWRTRTAPPFPTSLLCEFYGHASDDMVFVFATSAFTARPPSTVPWQQRYRPSEDLLNIELRVADMLCSWEDARNVDRTTLLPINMQRREYGSLRSEQEFRETFGHLRAQASYLALQLAKHQHAGWVDAFKNWRGRKKLPTLHDDYGRESPDRSLHYHLGFGTLVSNTDRWRNYG